MGGWEITKSGGEKNINWGVKRDVKTWEDQEDKGKIKLKKQREWGQQRFRKNLDGLEKNRTRGRWKGSYRKWRGKRIKKVKIPLSFIHIRVQVNSI